MMNITVGHLAGTKLYRSNRLQELAWDCRRTQQRSTISRTCTNALYCITVTSQVAYATQSYYNSGFWREKSYPACNGKTQVTFSKLYTLHLITTSRTYVEAIW